MTAEEISKLTFEYPHSALEAELHKLGILKEIAFQLATLNERMAIDAQIFDELRGGKANGLERKAAKAS